MHFHPQRTSNFAISSLRVTNDDRFLGTKVLFWEQRCQESLNSTLPVNRGNYRTPPKPEIGYRVRPQCRHTSSLQPQGHRQRAGGNEVVQPLTRRQSSARLIAMEGSAFNSLLRRWASSRCQGCKTIGSSDAPISSQRASTIRSFSATGRLWRSDRSMLIANST